MNTSFTSKQREVLARKLGYEGPMQGFDQYLQSSPALMMRYNAVTDKYAKRMAKGGVVGYADGGLVETMMGHIQIKPQGRSMLPMLFTSQTLVLKILILLRLC